MNDNDKAAYEHMGKNGIHRQKKSGEWVHETVGGKPFKSKAHEKKEHLARKMKGSADHINAERKRQGYKPMSAKDKRIHEGMDKYL